MDFRPRVHFIIFAAARPRFKSPRKAHGPEAVGFFFASFALILGPLSVKGASEAERPAKHATGQALESLAGGAKQVSKHRRGPPGSESTHRGDETMKNKTHQGIPLPLRSAGGRGGVTRYNYAMPKKARKGAVALQITRQSWDFQANRQPLL